MCTCTCPHTVWGARGEQKLEDLELESQAAVSGLCVSWELNSDPLEEQQGLLMAELSPKPALPFLHECCCYFSILLWKLSLYFRSEDYLL